jgi:peptidoglycan/LPS O-acetylase OafA/YrhL
MLPAMHRITPLDGWRGISISLVIIGHTWNYRLATHLEHKSNPASELAQLGVCIFFFISGFIITKMSLREHAATASFSIRSFYIRRIFRIISPFFIFLLVLVVARSLSLIDQPFAGIIKAGAFLCNIETDCGWFAGHSWSLAVEEQFYLLFPVLFAIVGFKLGRVTGLVLAIFLALPLVRFLLNFGPWASALIEFTTPFLFICFGCVAATQEARLERLSQSMWATYLSGAAVTVTLVVVLTNGSQPFPPASVGSRLLALLNFTALPISIAWLVGSSVYQRNAFTAIITTPPVLFVGSISYSLYLWQQLFVAPQSLYLTGSIFLFWPLQFVFAWLSYRFVETPSIRLGKQMMAVRKLAPLG